LLRRIQRRYQTVTETLRVGPLDLVFTRIADPDRVLDQVADEEDRRERRTGQRIEEDELHLPYWAELWDSSLALARYLVREHREPQSVTETRTAKTEPSVLDLGCGMGLAGTVAAAVGCRVLFADIEPAALLFARLNSLPWSNRVRTRRLNWRRDRLPERFDLILGADILYERAQWEYLDEFWRHHLNPGGRILLSEPGRQTGDLFIPWIQQRAWRLTQQTQSVPARTQPIRLLALWGNWPKTTGN
jgi:predicted nicotinamide N-methyase